MELHRKEQLTQYLISGFVGGAMAAIVLAIGAPQERNHFPELTVDSLVVNDRLAVRGEGNDGDSLLVKDGSLFVKNRIVATQFLGSQMASAVIVANRQMTTPDNLFATPADQWQFFTEIGSRCEDGGEMLVRSRRGGNCVGNDVTEGCVIRVGFDVNETTQLVSHNLAQNTTMSLARSTSVDGTGRRGPQSHMAGAQTTLPISPSPSESPNTALAPATPAVASAYAAQEPSLPLLESPPSVELKPLTPLDAVLPILPATGKATDTLLPLPVPPPIPAPNIAPTFVPNPF